MRVTDSEFVRQRLPKRPENANKGSVGTLYCICGSYSMAGACILSATAALRMGVGLVKIATVDSLYPILAPAVPEAVFDIVEDGNYFTVKGMSKLLCGCENAQAVLIGCGVGTDFKTFSLLTELIPQITKPLLIDADGINAVARHIFILDRMSSKDVVLTPHPKEMSRLTGKTVSDIQSSREANASEFAKRYSLTLLLKGFHTVISDADGICFENPTGNAGLATGGSGDVLSGMIASLMAQGMKGSDAAVCGAYIHGKTADILVKKTSQRYILPSDLVNNLYLWEKE